MNSLLRLAAAALVTSLALCAHAQRVQFPSATQPLSAAPPTTFAAPPPANSAFAAPPVSAPMYSPPPAYGAPVTPPAPFTTTAPAVAPPSAYSAPITTPAAPISPYPTTPAPPASTFGAPPPITPAPSLTSPAPLAPGSVSPPPPFDPYSTTPAPFGAPPAAVPYNYTPPPVAAPQTSPLYPNGLPYQFQPPPPGGQGYYATAQKLLQELSAEATWLYGDQSDPKDLAITRFELSSTFAVPMFYNIETPLLITPGFAFNWLQGPLANPADFPRPPDMPPRLYDAYLDFAWYPRVNQWLGAELGVRTGVWSDFDRVTTDSIRILGRGLASVSLTPQMDILFGAVYLDRLDVKILPAGGVYWRPTPEWDAYIVFPNPKVRKYWANVGNTKVYWYGAGEYGGGSWTVDRPAAGPNGALADQVDINDIRVIGGVEWETQTQIRGHFEVGYVWDRELLFRSGQPGSFHLDDTVMLRAGIDF